MVTTTTQAQTDSVPDRLAWDKSKKNSKELIKLLVDPLNLRDFEKQNPMHSNSGGANKQSYYSKPNSKGFYYRYFLFNNMVGYGPIIVTFQKDPTMKGYMDSSETFIELSCDKPFKTLGKIDFVGATLSEMIKKFGDNYLKSGDNWIYQYNNTILILHGKEKVTWFKVTLLNKSFKNFEEISKAEDLISYFEY
ncbi:MAG: hypothetical protein IPJ60_17430 [Sphingobacteriaceae bacterium]|nr:hypothetical protein [Sphingobacteriaceae bacterium]